MTRKAASVHFWMACATIGMGRLSMAVWFSHRYANGPVLRPFFSFTLSLIAVERAGLTAPGGSNYVPRKPFSCRTLRYCLRMPRTAWQHATGG